MKCMNENLCNVKWNQFDFDKEQSNILNEPQSYFMIKYNIHLCSNKYCTSQKVFEKLKSSGSMEIQLHRSSQFPLVLEKSRQTFHFNHLSNIEIDWNANLVLISFFGNFISSSTIFFHIENVDTLYLH